MADGQGEAAWGTSGQVTIGMMEQWNAGMLEQNSFSCVSFMVFLMKSVRYLRILNHEVYPPLA